MLCTYLSQFFLTFSYLTFLSYEIDKNVIKLNLCWKIRVKIISKPHYVCMTLLRRSKSSPVVPGRSRRYRRRRRTGPGPPGRTRRGARRLGGGGDVLRRLPPGGRVPGPDAGGPGGAHGGGGEERVGAGLRGADEGRRRAQREVLALRRGGQRVEAGKRQKQHRQRQQQQQRRQQQWQQQQCQQQQRQQRQLQQQQLQQQQWHQQQCQKEVPMQVPGLRDSVRYGSAAALGSSVHLMGGTDKAGRKRAETQVSRKIVIT